MRRASLLPLTPVLLTALPPLPIKWEMTTAAFGGQKAIVKLDSGARIEGICRVARLMQPYLDSLT
jgi:hypothetical protein